MLRALLDRLLVIVALTLGVQLPEGGDTVVALVLVVGAAANVWLRQHENKNNAHLISGLKELLEQPDLKLPEHLRYLEKCVECHQKPDKSLSGVIRRWRL